MNDSLMKSISRILISLLVLILIVAGLYYGGKYAQRKFDAAVSAATQQVTNSIQASLQRSLDEKMSGLQNDLDGKFATLNGKYDEQKKNIDSTRDQLNQLGDVWLRVEDVRTDEKHVGNTGSSGSQSTGSQTGSNGTHYARLPNSSVQFLKGEAYRADQCALRLGAAQEALVLYKGAFEKYQTFAAAYLNAAAVGEQQASKKKK